MKNFIPTYQSLTRHSIRVDILKFFHKKRQELQNKFREIFSVALTSDVWSGRAKHDYISIVAHYIDGDWNI